MFKIFLLVALLLIAYGFAVILLRRLSYCAQELASLHKQMARNDEKLHTQMQRLQQLQEHQGAKQSEVYDSPPTKNSRRHV